MRGEAFVAAHAYDQDDLLEAASDVASELKELKSLPQVLRSFQDSLNKISACVTG